MDFPCLRICMCLCVVAAGVNLLACMECKYVSIDGRLGYVCGSNKMGYRQELCTVSHKCICIHACKDQHKPTFKKALLAVKTKMHCHQQLAAMYILSCTVRTCLVLYAMYIQTGVFVFKQYSQTQPTPSPALPHNGPVNLTNIIFLSMWRQ